MQHHQQIHQQHQQQVQQIQYNKNHLKLLVDLIEVEYEYRVCEIKEMIDNVSSSNTITSLSWR